MPPAVGSALSSAQADTCQSSFHRKGSPRCRAAWAWRHSSSSRKRVSSTTVRSIVALTNEGWSAAAASSVVPDVGDGGTSTSSGCPSTVEKRAYRSHDTLQGKERLKLSVSLSPAGTNT